MAPLSAGGEAPALGAAGKLGAAEPPGFARVISAVLLKNWKLKTRGLVACCSVAEIIVPLIFIGLLTVPRTLIPPVATPATYYSPANLSDLAWSGSAPPGGAWQIHYAPSGSASAVQVAEMAAKDLLCSSPSLVQQLAIAASVSIDLAGIEAAGLGGACLQQPLACVGYVHAKDGGLPLDSPLLLGDYEAMCTPACLASRACFGPVLAQFLVGHPDGGAAEAAALDAATGPRVAAVVLLPAEVASADDVTYTIRVNSSSVPGTAQFGPKWAHVAFDQWVVGPSASWKSYWLFANLQKAFDAAFISVKTQPDALHAQLLRLGGVTDVRLETTVKSFAQLPYKTNLGGSFAGLFFGVAFVFAFLSSVVLIVKSIVMEKELRIREAMLISGLAPRVYWASWFITHYSSLVLVSLAMALIGTRAFVYSSPFFLCAFYLTWTASLVSFCYLLSTLFSTSKMASIVGSLLYILTWVPAVAATSGDGALGNAGWTATCVLPASSLYMWGLAVALLENAERGVTGDTLWLNLLSASDGAAGGASSFSAGAVLVITAASGLAYALLAAYLDAVVEQPFGAALPWHFPLSHLPWPRRGARQQAQPFAAAPGDDDVEADALLEGACEAGPPGAQPALALCGLRKIFPLPARLGGPVAAVDGLTLSLFGGEVSALLGHNGAGKTTTIGVVTGLLPASGGGVSVAGRPLSAMAHIRRSLGWCPQHDVLWPQLSCEEHVRLYLAFRGVGRAAAAAAAAEALRGVGLAEKAGAAAGTLSGGQRRKLSLAIAFAGSPQLVLLDEPTVRALATTCVALSHDRGQTGMDAFSRRQAWAYIRGQKAADRAIVLSTHFMEEADLLCDRIAIMAAGKLAACGSPLFLKARLGLGYHLGLQLARGDGGDGGGGGAGAADLGAIAQLVREHVPGAVLESQCGAEASFLLPPEDGDPGHSASPLPPLLRELDGRGRQLGCEAFGLTCATMEEVFLSVAAHCTGGRSSAAALRAAAVAAKRDAAARRASPPPTPSPLSSARRAALQAELVAATVGDGSDSSLSPSPSAPPAPARLAGARLAGAQLRALLRKRLLHARRDRLGWATMYGVPLAFVALALGLAHLGQLQTGLPGAEMGPAFLAFRPIRAAAAADVPPADAAAFARSLAGSEWLPAPAAQWACEAPAAAAAAAAAAAVAGPFAGLAASLAGGAALSCQPAAQNCAALGCTPHAAAARTLDGVVMASERAHENCRQTAGGACGALYLSAAQAARRRFAYTLSVSPSAFHALPALQAAADSAALSALLGRPARLRVTNEPLPPAGGGGAAGQALMLRMLIGLCSVLALGSLSASVSVFLVAERRAGAKHLQLVSGVGRGAFWLATVLWDAANYALPLALLTAAFAASQLDAFDSNGALAVVFLALLLFGASAIPLSYLLHFCFSDEMNSLAGQMAVYYFFGVAQTLAAVILQGLAALGTARDAWRTAAILFRWLPHYNFAIIVVKLCENAQADAGARQSPWAPEVSGTELRVMLAEAFVFSAAAFAVDAAPWLAAAAARCRRALARVAPAPPPPAAAAAARDDRDVASERARVEAALAGGGQPSDILTLSGLRKTYGGGGGGGGAAAVRPLSLGLAEGRCFGLLGVNGAGKSTTFRMLTGEVSPSGGDALVRDRAACAPHRRPPARSVLRELDGARQLMGLCPQEDALLALLTPREQLCMYARLRGVTHPAVPGLAQELLGRLGLARWADRPAGRLSGGNKRKLGVAIALIGEPPLVLLDEPSSGMDPAARRAMWAVLGEANAGRALLLTTHCMAEAEALCHTLAIMVAGRLVCLGSLGALQRRHGGGHSVELRCASAPGAAEALAARVAAAMPAARLAELQPGRLTLRLPSSGEAGGGGALGATFEAVERLAGSNIGILDYSVSAESLEQIFLRFAQRGAEGGAAAAAEEEEEAEASARPAARARVQCPCCRALLRWEAEAPIQRCGRCDALVGLPADGAELV